MSIREQELVAGRELDALVATNVMGWDQQIESWYDEEGVDTDVWIDDDGARYSQGMGADTTDLPAFSTDIAAAWQVVAKLGLPFQTHFYPLSDRWWARFTNFGEGDGDTAPLAICRAALAAVGGT